MRSGKHQNGAVAEAATIKELNEVGVAVSVPTTEERYDLIADVGDELLRIQVKCGWFYEEGKLRVELRNATRDSNGDNKKNYYEECEVDGFIIYNPREDETYFLQESDAPASNTRRRVETWRESLTVEAFGDSGE
jgi:hypothetical protein